MLVHTDPWEHANANQVHLQMQIMSSNTKDGRLDTFLDFLAKKKTGFELK